jgi:hypothetical protein
MTPPNSFSNDSGRAQSNTLAIALIVSIVFMGGLFTVYAQTETLNSFQAVAEADTAESSMVYLASQMSNVAFSASDSTEDLRFTATSYGTVTADDGGNIEIEIEPTSGGTETIMDESLGTIRYTGGENAELAVQGGGVWRTTQSGDANAVLISGPPITYSDGTLNAPIQRIDADESHIISPNIEIWTQSYENPAGPRRTVHYPNESAGDTNPVTDATVRITITSEYSDAWGDYFESNGATSVDRSVGANTVEVEYDYNSISEDGYIHIADTELTVN